MNVVAFVPLKLNNERLPGKNLKKFQDGTPLLACILNTLLNSDGLDAVYVYCSDDSVLPYLPAGVKFIRRSTSLDLSSTKINEVLQSFAADVPADIYVLAHATAPFLSSISIGTAVKAVRSGNYDSALSVCRMQEFLWRDGAPMNYELSSIPRTQDLNPLFVETTGLYVYKRELMTEENRRVGNRPFLVEVSKTEGVDINHGEDFELASALYSSFMKKRIFGE